MTNGKPAHGSRETDFKPWIGIGAVAGFVAIQSVAHNADGTRHESSEQKENRIIRIVDERLDERVPPPEVRAELRRLSRELERLKEDKK